MYDLQAPSLPVVVAPATAAADSPRYSDSQFDMDVDRDAGADVTAPNPYPTPSPTNAGWTANIRFAGQTFATSTDGQPVGERKPEAVQGVMHSSAAGREECFQFELQPLSSALLVIPAAQSQD